MYDMESAMNPKDFERIKKIAFQYGDLVSDVKKNFDIDSEAALYVVLEAGKSVRQQNRAATIKKRRGQQPQIPQSIGDIDCMEDWEM